MADYGQRREQALGRLRELVAARQRWDDMNFQRMEAEEKRLKDEAYQAERAEKLNWLDEAAQGAALGSSMGPVGAWIGAAGGALYGQKQAYDQRRSEGQGRWDAFTGTHFDTPFGKTNTVNKESFMNAMGAAARAKAVSDQQKAREGAYQPTDTEIMGAKSAQPDWGKKYGTDYGQGKQTVPDSYQSNVDIDSSSSWGGYDESAPVASPATVEYYNDPYDPERIKGR